MAGSSLEPGSHAVMKIYMGLVCSTSCEPVAFMRSQGFRSDRANNSETNL